MRRVITDKIAALPLIQSLSSAVVGRCGIYPRPSIVVPGALIEIVNLSHSSRLQFSCAVCTIMHRCNRTSHSALYVLRDCVPHRPLNSSPKTVTVLTNPSQ